MGLETLQEPSSSLEHLKLAASLYGNNTFQHLDELDVREDEFVVSSLIRFQLFRPWLVSTSRLPLDQGSTGGTELPWRWL